MHTHTHFPSMEAAPHALLQGPYYARMPDGSKSLFALGENGRGTQLAGLRAYVAEGAGKCQVVQEHDLPAAKQACCWCCHGQFWLVSAAV